MDREYKRIYAYETLSSKNIKWEHRTQVGKGLIKVGKSSGVNSDERIRQQFQGDIKTIKDSSWNKLVDVEAIDVNGDYFLDTKVHKVLRKKYNAYQVPHTEWFECTLNEVRQAINDCKNHPELFSRAEKYSEKNTVEKRGAKKNYEIAKKERSRILQPSLIIKMLQRYPQENSNVKLAKVIVKELNIQQYSPSTVSIMIGNIVNRLIEDGFLKRTTVGNKAELHLTNSKLSLPDISDNETEQNLSTSDLIQLISMSKFGYTLKELSSKTHMSKCRLHNKLTNKVKIVYVKKKNSSFNGFEVRLFVEHQKIELPKDEVEYTPRVNISPETVLKVKKGLKRLCTSRTFDKIRELSGEELLDSDIEGVIKNNAHFNNRFLIFENTVYRRGYEPKNTITRRSGIKFLKENMESLLRENNTGLTFTEIRDNFKNYSKSVCYSVLKELKDDKIVVKLVSSSYTFGPNDNKKEILYIHCSKLPFSDIIKQVNQKTQYMCFKTGMSEKEILNIIKENPYINNTDLLIKLHEIYPNYAASSFMTPVSQITKLLYKNKIITNMGDNSKYKWHIVDSDHIWRQKSTYDMTEIIEYVKNQPNGATIKEIYRNIHTTAPIGTIGIHIIKSPLFNYIKEYCSNGVNFYYRIFVKGQKVTLPEGTLADGYGI